MSSPDPGTGSSGTDRHTIGGVLTLAEVGLTTLVCGSAPVGWTVMPGTTPVSPGSPLDSILGESRPPVAHFGP